LQAARARFKPPLLEPRRGAGYHRCPTPNDASARDVASACLIIIGNEILSGRTKDENLHYLAQRLGEWGVPMTEARVVPDIEGPIIQAVNECRRVHDYVFTTGGIGPTHDDITSAAVAKAFGVPLVRDPEAVKRLQAQYAAGDLNEARLKMADVPEGAELIDNPVSRAPGFRMENVFVLAGIPSIMRAMVDSLRHMVVGGAPIQSRAVRFHLAEGVIAKDLGALAARYPELTIGSYPFYRQGQFGVVIVLRGTDGGALGRANEELNALVRALGGTPVQESAA
jgi:molybdopterin-biosynthesis enzyme MoeA-like protein